MNYFGYVAEKKLISYALIVSVYVYLGAHRCEVSWKVFFWAVQGRINFISFFLASSNENDLHKIVQVENIRDSSSPEKKVKTRASFPANLTSSFD
jgi:hypothetical protein